MALFGGRILITDCPNKDDRDAVIANILNHKLSRATLYVMINDFKDIQSVRQNFPTVVPFVLIPGENIVTTRRMLHNLLPHMDHFVNFLGQDLALEFLNKRSDFRIKSVSRAYARSNVVDKILSSNEQGIIFNVDASDNICTDNVVAAGIAAKKTIKGSVKKVFLGLTGPSSSSTDEQEPLLSNDSHHHTEPVVTMKLSQSMTSNVWRFIVSLYYYLCPCISDARIIIPVNEYPSNMDAKLMEAFDELCRSQEAEWFQKLVEARQSKEKAILQLQSTKEERIEREYNRLMGVKGELTGTGSTNHRYQAFVNVREIIKLEKDRICREYDRRAELLYSHHYCVIVDEQCQMLVSFWKKMRLILM